jgi:hypothetical protein
MVPLSPDLNKGVGIIGNYISRNGKRSEKIKVQDEKVPNYVSRYPFTQLCVAYEDKTQEGLMVLPLPEESSGNISLPGKMKIAKGDKEKVAFKLYI